MNSRISLFIVQLILFGTINLYSQYPSCDLVPSEDVICDFELLHGLSGTMISENSSGSQPAPLCPDGGIANNILWFAFIAPEGGPYSISITMNNCVITDSMGGVQIGIYTDCTFTASVYCDPSCNLDPVNIPSDVFVPGQVYYLFIDGCFNTVCDYEISLSGTFDANSQFLGHTFIDYNSDGIQNGLEPDLENVNIALDPGSQMTLSNSDGNFSFDEFPVDSFTITATIMEGEWEEDEIIIEIPEFVFCDPIEIGFVPLPSAIPDALVSISNSIARCNLKTNFYITIQNISSNTLDGTFEFTYDDLTSFVSSDIPGILFNGNTAIANTGILAPFEIKDYLVKLKMPAESDPLPELQFEITVFDNMQSSIAEYAYADQLRCSYDPNDKIEHPDRPGEDNLTLIDEDLEYKIRFQNNGNDTAFLVKIVDVLDPNVDPKSIRVVNSSHAVETCIEDHTLIFLFENINLVDSMTNYDASQGFVTFRSSTKEGRAENTPVHNTADIIFDTNIPIVTNTTLNTLVSQLCANVTTEIDIEICEGEVYDGHEESGFYTTIIPLPYGCDSIVIVNLDVQGITYSSQDIGICEGDSIVLNGTLYTFSESQEIKDTVTNSIGCISNILTYDFLVIPIIHIDIDTTICEGMDYEGLEESGTYNINSFDEITGCDIITTVDLEVLPMSDPSCIVGIEEYEEEVIKVYPNPANDIVIIEGESDIESVSIYSIAYTKISQEKFTNRSSKIQLNTNRLSHGLYFLEIKTSGKSIYKKLIIE